MRYLPLLLYFYAVSVEAREWMFDVYLDQQRIGQHSFKLVEDGSLKTLISDANFHVKLLFIDAYRYIHTAQEKWQGDCLASLDAHTEENQQVSVVTGRLVSHEFEITGPKGSQVLPSCVMTFAYWNPYMLQQHKLINPQNGEWQNVNIRFVGEETLQMKVNSVTAEHYKLTGNKLDIDLWYSSTKDWLALQSTTPEGYVIRYKLR